MQEAYASRYAEFEARHWWFRARRQILRDRLLALPLPPKPATMEVGVGPGENLYTIYPDGARVVGVEPEPTLAALARVRGSIPIYETTVEELPDSLADSSFDLVTLLDVLEHTRDDVLALECVREKLAPGGYLVITVPAFMFLWGEHDVVNEHYRRYTRKELVSKVRQSGFDVLRTTYFSTLLFPPVVLFRFLRRFLNKPEEAARSDLRHSLWLGDRLLYHIFVLEKWLLRAVDLPVGTSVMVVARKS